MLYVTTRNNRDAYTAQRVLRENRGPDGGLYVPFREPVFSREEIDALKEQHRKNPPWTPWGGGKLNG